MNAPSATLPKCGPPRNQKAEDRWATVFQELTYPPDGIGIIVKAPKERKAIPMRDFFKGSRPKTGVAILLMALGFMSAWIRSCTTDDAIQWRAEPQSLVTLASCNSRIEWDRRFLSPRAPIGWGWTDSIEFLSGPAENTDIFLEQFTVTRRWEWCGFCFGEVVAIDQPDARLVISR